MQGGHGRLVQGDQRAGPSALAGAVCAGIGTGCLLGTAIEPVTWRPRAWSPVTTLAIIANTAASVALTAAGWRPLAATRSRAIHLRHRGDGPGRVRSARLLVEEGESDRAEQW